MTAPTTPDRETLERLAERCEQATGPDRKLDVAIWLEIDPRNRSGWLGAYQRNMGLRAKGSLPPTFEQWLAKATVSVVPAYTASLDAAMTLVPKDHSWEAGSEGLVDKPYAHIMCWEDGQLSHCNAAATPVLALCAAALRARTHTEKD